MVVTSSLKDFTAEMVLAGGKIVAKESRNTNDWAIPNVDDRGVRDTIRIHTDNIDLRIPVRNDRSHCRVRVIGIIADQLVTEERVMDATIVKSKAVSDPSRDLLKLAVIERHGVAG